MNVVKGLAVALAIAIALPLGLTAIVFINDAAAVVPPGGGRGLRGVPEEFRPWILRAARQCEHPELAPALLAAQLNQESGFRTDRRAVSTTGAMGPAQFMPGTWATWGRDADGNGRADPFDIGDAVTAQGRMMCSLIGQAKSSALTGDVRRLALAGYNAGWGRVEQFGGVPPESFARGETYHYVKNIIDTMPRYEGTDGSLKVDGTGPGADALRKADGRLGTPYSWGGGTPAGPSTGFCDGTNGYLNGRCVAAHTEGFDCSSLVQYAYWDSTHLPRTAAEQYNATAHHPVARQQLQPGDLLFWAHSDGHIYHVALYTGDGTVIQAPRTEVNGKLGRVEIADWKHAMPLADYHGATRP